MPVGGRLATLDAEDGGVYIGGDEFVGGLAERGGSLSFSVDGRQLLVASHKASLWDAATGFGHFTLNEDSVSAAAFSLDGRQIVTASSTVKLWDAATGSELATLEDRPSTITTYSPDGSRIVTASPDGTAHVIAVPPIFRASPQELVVLACESLWRVGAPLAFTKEDALRFPVLQGEPTAPDGDFVSPCQGVLPKEAFPAPSR
jgi:WD40 repeat protein